VHHDGATPHSYRLSRCYPPFWFSGANILSNLQVDDFLRSNTGHTSKTGTHSGVLFSTCVLILICVLILCSLDQSAGGRRLEDSHAHTYTHAHTRTHTRMPTMHLIQLSNAAVDMLMAGIW